jgi:hypothetical protein
VIAGIINIHSQPNPVFNEPRPSSGFALGRSTRTATLVRAITDASRSVVAGALATATVSEEATEVDAHQGVEQKPPRQQPRHRRRWAPVEFSLPKCDASELQY